MTISVDQLKSLAQAEGLGYFIDPNRPAIILNFTGINGNYMIAMLVELDGRFIQYRTVGYGSCPSSHAHLPAVLRVLTDLDYRLRLTKFGWDASDGEIVAYVDLWLEDAVLTQHQFAAMLRAFLPAIDMGRVRIARTIETGIDPEVTGVAPGTPAAPPPAPRPDPVSV